MVRRRGVAGAPNATQHVAARRRQIEARLARANRLAIENLRDTMQYSTTVLGELMKEFARSNDILFDHLKATHPERNFDHIKAELNKKREEHKRLFEEFQARQRRIQRRATFLSSPPQSPSPSPSPSSSLPSSPPSSSPSSPSSPQ